VQGASPVILVPQTYWNAERLSVKYLQMHHHR